MLSSCCRRRGGKKQSSEIELVAPVAVANTLEEENTQSVIPTTTQYLTATGKQALTLLELAASLIPVPLVQSAIRVAITIINICEEASAVHGKVRELQMRIGHIMITIVDNVTTIYEEGNEVIVKAMKGFEKDIGDLLRTLKAIDNQLAEIRGQKEWLLGLYSNLTMSVIERCLTQLSTAEAKFKLANDLRDTNLILELHSRLTKLPKGVDEIHEDIKQLREDVKHVADKVEPILTYLSKSKQSAMQRMSERFRYRIPLKPEILHGRDDLVEKIAQWLVKKETARVCLLGPGGMGKTSVSLAVIGLPFIKQRFPGRSCVWVPCIQATSAALLLEILYTQLQIPGDMQVTLEEIIFRLKCSEDACLILLDNFETPWNTPGAEKEVKDILHQLAALGHVAIFITMRGRIPPCNNTIKWQWVNIEPADEAACLRIYHDNNPGSRDPDAEIVPLLAALGYMPFAVMLMAKLGMEGLSTAKDLLNGWLESGPDMLSENPEESMNRSISHSVESEIVKRNPNAYTLLSILSLLPAGVMKQNLSWWAPDSALKQSMIPSAIATLSKAGLLVENRQEFSLSPILSVNPIVQSFMQQHGRIEDKIRKQVQMFCCQYVLDHACRFEDPTFPEKSKALAAEDTNIQSILFGSPNTHPSDRTIEALIAFAWYRSDTKPDLGITNHAVEVAKISEVKKYIASAEWCLGWTHRQLGDYRSSSTHMQAAYLLSSGASAGEVELQKLHCKCGIDLVEAVRFEDRHKAVSLAHDLETECAALSDDSIHGLSLTALGEALTEIQQNQTALEYLNRARIMLQAVNNAPHLATTYQIIARAHYYERRFPEALAAIQDAWTLVESSSSSNQTQSYISLESGLIHFGANEDTEAWKYLEIALTKATNVGSRFIIGRALELMGYGYLRRGDFENAYGAYKAALDNYRGTVDEGDEKCKENMTRIRRKQENPDEEIGFHRTEVDVDKAHLFFPLVQAPASGDLNQQELD